MSGLSMKFNLRSKHMHMERTLLLTSRGTRLELRLLDAFQENRCAQAFGRHCNQWWCWCWQEPLPGRTSLNPPPRFSISWFKWWFWNGCVFGLWLLLYIIHTHTHTIYIIFLPLSQIFGAKPVDSTHLNRVKAVLSVCLDIHCKHTPANCLSCLPGLNKSCRFCKAQTLPGGLLC